MNKPIKKGLSSKIKTKSSLEKKSSAATAAIAKKLAKAKARVSTEIVTKKEEKVTDKEVKKKEKIKNKVNNTTLNKKREESTVSIIDPQKMETIFKKGRLRGFVTFSEILSSFPNLEENINEVEDLFAKLEQAGIDVKS